MQSLFLTGNPRVGKTTIISKVVKYLQTTYPETISTHGFYTSEVLGSDNSRVGFDIITIDGQKGVLSRKNLPLPIANYNNIPKVGAYMVFLEEFERLAVPSITINEYDDKKKESKKQVIVIDEVGKMECFSNKFNETVRNLVLRENINENVNDVCVIGTVALNHIGLAKEIRNKAGFGKNSKSKENKNLSVWEVTYENREYMVNNVILELEKMLNVRNE
ncbi:nucleoside-triphosphatase [Glomus cerebriforme]|uniref:Nucleoside-triphosphatase n=1 Tax=Glomus cerebriforme TaxID=658196 RepID=A0A397T6B1_9GLOM|nr:nucleoside-triphosphatase [Glomus cerebriforme]